MSITSDLTNGSKKKKVFPKDSKAIILYKIKI
jgi:hypothetical protein